MGNDHVRDFVGLRAKVMPKSLPLVPAMGNSDPEIGESPISAPSLEGVSDLGDLRRSWKYHHRSMSWVEVSIVPSCKQCFDGELLEGGPQKKKKNTTVVLFYVKLHVVANEKVFKYINQLTVI